jgi:putative oxidoreductase
MLLVRVGLALVFIAHGWAKLSDMEGTVAFFASIGLASFFAYAVAIVELVGGIAMLVGLYTGVAGILLAVTMLGAIGLVKLGAGFLGGYEFDILLFLSAIAVALGGPGKYTAQYFMKRA